MREEKEEGKWRGGGADGGKPLFMGLLRGRGGGLKAQPLSGKQLKLGDCLDAGRERCGKMEGKRAEYRYLWGFQGGGEEDRRYSL